MAREENKNKYSNIEHVRTNMLWMDIKIVDPEMEALMKQINEEQMRLKEALREKLRLMRYDTDVLQKENEQTKAWLLSKGIQFEEKKDNTAVKEENGIRIKEEPADAEVNGNDCHEEKVRACNLEETTQTKDVPSKSMKETENMDIEISRINDNEENKRDVNNKNDNLKESCKITNKEVVNPCVNDQITKEESDIAKRMRKSDQINAELIEDILLNEKKSKRGMKRRRLLKKFRASSKRKKYAAEKIKEAQSTESTKEEGEP